MGFRGRRRLAIPALVALVLGVPAWFGVQALVGDHGADEPPWTPAPPMAADAPNIFFYNLDDLRDAFPGGIDPLRYMPKTRAWMADGLRYTQTFVASPSCGPSRASLMTGRYPHDNGVHDQQMGPRFDGSHSMACYLRDAGYATYEDGKFLTTWPRDQRPPCFSHSTVMWGGYEDVGVKVDGVPQQAAGYDTTYLGRRGRQYIGQALDARSHFALYETPQAPHWFGVTEPDGTQRKLAIPDRRYAHAPVADCAGVPEADRSDKPAYVRTMNYTTAQALAMCRSQLRSVMTADDEFAATMRMLRRRGVLDDTLVIFSSDNGYLWGEHGRWEKFTPYEPSMRVPLLLRWPGHVPRGTDRTRLVSYLDLLPTMLDAAGTRVPAGAPPLDGESLLRPSQRTTLYGEYYRDPANPQVPSWRMIRTSHEVYVETYAPGAMGTTGGSIAAREYYDLREDPAEDTNLLGDGDPSDDPPARTLRDLARRLHELARCDGADCVR